MDAPRGGPSLIEYGLPAQGRPVAGRAGVVLLFVRVLVGVAAVLVAVLNGFAHATVAAHAADWGLPAPSLAIWLGVLLLLLGGIGLVLGIASRLCALVLLIVMLVVVATAGRVDGGAPLFGSALLVIGCLVIVARGGGVAQLIDRFDPPRW
ncbi:MAG: DoxX family membrane protein [Gaiellales bacterium]